MPLFQPLGQIARTVLFSLQVGEASGDLAVGAIIDLAPELEDFAATAAVNDPRQPQLAANSLALYLHQARLLANKGSSSVARRCFLGAVAVAPGSAEAHRDFGIFLMHQLEFDLAETHLLQAGKIAPDDKRIQQTLLRLQQLKEKGAG